MTKKKWNSHKSQLNHEGLNVLKLENDSNNTFHFYSIFHLGIPRSVINITDSFKILSVPSCSKHADKKSLYGH